MIRASLQCHPAAPCVALQAIDVTVSRRERQVELAYLMRGDIAALRIPLPKAPTTGKQLWQHTCCEAFIALNGTPGYREYNFSPSGEWAGFEFTRYREGGPAAVPDPGISIRRADGELQLKAAVQVDDGALLLGLSAVIEAADGTLSYWALRHAPGKPDFHHRDAFAMELDEARH